MGKLFWGWIAWFLFLFALDFTIPFIGFKHIPKVTGSFLFWILWVVVAIASMFLIFFRWRENYDNNEEDHP